MANPQFVVSANFIASTQLVAAAVIYRYDFPEPSFAYPARGKTQVVSLYRRGHRVPPQFLPALSDYIRGSSVSWALVTAHPECPPSSALSLAIVRAVERWYCRQPLPSLKDVFVHLPLRHPLEDLPSNLHQAVNVHNWRTAAARVLCKNYAPHT